MSKSIRRKFGDAFKANVCIEAIREQQTIEALSKKYDLHPTRINAWKKDFVSNSSTVFENEGKPGVPEVNRPADPDYCRERRI